MTKVSKEVVGTAPDADKCTKPSKEETSVGNPAASENSSYTVFTSSDLRRLRIILDLGTITSPLTANIYLPPLPLLRHQFSVSSQAINLTLTLYIIFQAISPVIFGPFSDAYGRRPIFLLTLGLRVLGNIGLAANRDSYAVLLILRAVQSLGASAAYAISFGVVADVCQPNERGRMLGLINMALNHGACVDPVVGGIVAYANDNHAWVFWSLIIVGIVLYLGVDLLLPETAKRLGSHSKVNVGSENSANSEESLHKSMLSSSLESEALEPVMSTLAANPGEGVSYIQLFTQPDDFRGSF